MKRIDGDYIEDVINAITTIEKFTNSHSYEEFLADERNFHTAVRMFEIIGEACNKISEDLKEKNPDVPWREIISMRNKLIQ